MSKFISRAAFVGAAIYSGALALTQRGQLWDALRTRLGLTDVNRTTVTATGALTVNQCGPLQVDATAGNMVLTLPASGASADEAVYEIDRIDATVNTVTVAAAGADTIDGVASVLVTGTMMLRLPAGSTVWRVHSISGATPARARAALGVSAGRNLLDNANFKINQRGYVSAAATSIANQYTLDRWRVVTLGQNISFAASGNGNIVTAPAGGIEQVVEGLNIGVAAHVINWVGTATCTVDGAAKTKGASVTLVPGTNATVKFVGGTVSQAQLEPGSVATEFEFRHHQLDLMLCARYFQISANPSFYLLPLGSASVQNGYSVRFGSPMRATPTIVTTVTAGTATVSGLISSSANGFTANISGLQYETIQFTWTASAEL